MKRAALALALAACGSTAASPAEAPPPSDAVVYVNANVLTPDGARAALRVEGARITHVLEADDPALAGARVDLEGATIVAGLVDAHLHLRGVGRARRNVDLLGTGSAAEVIERVAAVAAEREPGRWIRGRGWDQNDWEVTEFPTHEALSALVPEHPVLLRRVDGHAAWANARAMALAGIDASTEDPEGGEIVRDAEGAPTGVFVDNAVDLFGPHLPDASAEEIRDDLVRAMALCADAGLTGVHDMGVDPPTLEQLRILEREGAMPIRVAAYLEGSHEGTDALLDAPPDREGPLTVIGVKHYIDGALGSRGAALFEDYGDREGHRGLLVQSAEALTEKARRAHAAGYQIAIHAIGDRGIATALDAIAAAQGEERARHRVEHVQVIREEDVARLVELGVVASMQPTHATSDMPWAEARVGADRIRGAYAWRTMLEAGALLAFGSDAPVESHRPALGLYAAITRQDADGQPEGGWTPEERLTIEEALRAFSEGPARALGRDDLGVIRPGAVADLTILAADPTEIAPAELREIGIVGTVVGGVLRRVTEAEVP